MGLLRRERGPRRQPRANISLEHRSISSPQGLGLGNFHFYVLGVRNRKDYALALLPSLGSSKAWLRGSEGRSAPGSARVPGAPAWGPRGFSGEGVAPLSGGRLRQQEGVSGFHERRWPCDFFPIQAHLPGLSDSLTSSCLGRRRVAPDPTMPLGAGWEPRNTLHRGLLQK